MGTWLGAVRSRGLLLFIAASACLVAMALQRPAAPAPPPGFGSPPPGIVRVVAYDEATRRLSCETRDTPPAPVVYDMDEDAASRFRSAPPAPGSLWWVQLPRVSGEGARAMPVVVAVSKPMVAGVLLLWAALLVGGAMAVLNKDVPGLIKGIDGPYSKSKVQAALWFILAICGLLSAWLLRVRSFGLGFSGGIGIPQNLALLSGFAAVTLVSAKWIRAGDPVAARQFGLASHGLVRDLVHDDRGRPSLPDMQMLVLMLITVAVYAATLASFLRELTAVPSTSLPDVDGAWMALMGIGQGTYLVAKAAGDHSGRAYARQTPSIQEKAMVDIGPRGCGHPVHFALIVPSRGGAEIAVLFKGRAGDDTNVHVRYYRPDGAKDPETDDDIVPVSSGALVAQITSRIPGADRVTVQTMCGQDGRYNGDEVTAQRLA